MAFMACMVTVGLSSCVVAISNIRVNRENSEDMQAVMEMIATYLGSATQDEYDEIAKTIRNDLVFSEYGQEIENCIQYIPNTAETCRTCIWQTVLIWNVRQWSFPNRSGKMPQNNSCPKKC